MSSEIRGWWTRISIKLGWFPVWISWIYCSTGVCKRGKLCSTRACHYDTSVCKRARITAMSKWSCIAINKNKINKNGALLMEVFSPIHSSTLICKTYTFIASFVVAIKVPLLGSLGLLLLLLLLLLLFVESRRWPVRSSGSFFTAAATAESSGDDVTIVVTGDDKDDVWLLLSKVVISIWDACAGKRCCEDVVTWCPFNICTSFSKAIILPTLSSTFKHPNQNMYRKLLMPIDNRLVLQF